MPKIAKFSLNFNGHSFEDRGNRELLVFRPTLNAVVHRSDPGRHNDAQHTHGIPSIIPPGGSLEETASPRPKEGGVADRGKGADKATGGCETPEHTEAPDDSTHR